MTQQDNNTRNGQNQQDSGRIISNDNNSDSRQFSNNVDSADESRSNAPGNSKGNSNIAGDNTVKDPDNWTTGNEPMTGAQSSYLNTLASEAGEAIEENLTKAEASKKIDELQHKTGRGLQGADDSA